MFIPGDSNISVAGGVVERSPVKPGMTGSSGYGQMTPEQKLEYDRRATMNAPAVPREMPLMVMRPSAYPSTAIISTENIRKDMPEMVITPPNKLIIIYLAFLYFFAMCYFINNLLR